MQSGVELDRYNAHTAEDCANAAVRAMRQAEATLALEERGEPPFKAGDVLKLEHGDAEVLHVWWDDVSRDWFVDIMYERRRLNGLAASTLPKAAP